MPRTFAEFKKALVESWNPVPEEEGSGLEPIPDEFHQPSFLGAGYIITNPSNNSTRESWGNCYRRDVDAYKDVIEAMQFNPKYPGSIPHWSDILIEKVEFSQGIPLSRPLANPGCPNTNTAFNAAESRDFISCPLCYIEGVSSHWYLKK
jgi:hypothetical protein